eukprot:scaffold4393_cov252-Prasinococcus_capsulatus_cf.AAC.3
MRPSGSLVWAQLLCSARQASVLACSSCTPLYPHLWARHRHLCDGRDRRRRTRITLPRVAQPLPQLPRRTHARRFLRRPSYPRSLAPEKKKRLLVVAAVCLFVGGVEVRQRAAVTADLTLKNTIS